MSITAPGSVMLRRWQHCWKALAPAAVTATVLGECKNSDFDHRHRRQPDQKTIRLRQPSSRQAAKRGAKLVVDGSARTGAVKRHAWKIDLQFKNGHRRRACSTPCCTCDHWRETLTDQQYVADLMSKVSIEIAENDPKDFTPEEPWSRSAVFPPTRCVTVARMLRARRKRSIIFWGMGVSHNTPTAPTMPAA